MASSPMTGVCTKRAAIQARKTNALWTDTMLYWEAGVEGRLTSVGWTPVLGVDAWRAVGVALSGTEETPAPYPTTPVNRG